MSKRKRAKSTREEGRHGAHGATDFDEDATFELNDDDIDDEEHDPDSSGHRSHVPRGAHGRRGGAREQGRHRRGHARSAFEDDPDDEL
jgi:hypothetical protein